MKNIDFSQLSDTQINYLLQQLINAPLRQHSPNAAVRTQLLAQAAEQLRSVAASATTVDDPAPPPPEKPPCLCATRGPSYPALGHLQLV